MENPFLYYPHGDPIDHFLLRRCLSKSGLIVGDLEHLADTPSSAKEELVTGKLDVFGCPTEEEINKRVPHLDI